MLWFVLCYNEILTSKGQSLTLYSVSSVTAATEGLPQVFEVPFLQCFQEAFTFE